MEVSINTISNQYVLYSGVLTPLRRTMLRVNFPSCTFSISITSFRIVDIDLPSSVRVREGVCECVWVCVGMCVIHRI